MKTGKALIEEINRTRTKPSQCAFWWLGQHSFVVKLGDSVCYLDPFLTPLKERLVPPLLAPEDITNANLVLGSHDHIDHIDRKAWPGIAVASPGAIFVTPKLLCIKIAEALNIPRKRVLGVDFKQNIKINGVNISGVPAAHEILNPDPRTGLNPCVGFVVEANEFCLYHSGDTCIYEGMQAILRQWSLDLAFLPINGRDAKRYASGCIGNMTFQEAADLAGATSPGVTVPAHFEMFAMNSQDPSEFVEYMRVKYPQLRVILPQHGIRTLIKKVSKA